MAHHTATTQLSCTGPVDAVPEPCAMDGQVGGSHYKDMAIQPAEYIERNGLSYLEGAAIKYISRWRKKGGKQDLDKAIHCLQLLRHLNP